MFLVFDFFTIQISLSTRLPRKSTHPVYRTITWDSMLYYHDDNIYVTGKYVIQNFSFRLRITVRIRNKCGLYCVEKKKTRFHQNILLPLCTVITVYNRCVPIYVATLYYILWNRPCNV